MNRKIRTHVASIRDGFTLKRSASSSEGSGEGEVSREVSRQGSQDEIHQMEELDERGAWAHGGMMYGRGEGDIPRNVME